MTSFIPKFQLYCKTSITVTSVKVKQSSLRIKLRAANFNGLFVYIILLNYFTLQKLSLFRFIVIDNITINTHPQLKICDKIALFVKKQSKRRQFRSSTTFHNHSSIEKIHRLPLLTVHMAIPGINLNRGFTVLPEIVSNYDSSH